MAHLCRISISVTDRNKSAGTMRSGRQLSTVSISKAVIPLSADAVEKVLW